MAGKKEIIDAFKETLSRKLTDSKDSPPCQLDLTLELDGVRRNISIVILETNFSEDEKDSGEKAALKSS